MSEFDKEAEREKLRKKFEKEEEDRKRTEHMSDLLLRGATMMNVHCSRCSSPLFRYDGEEFCPTCKVSRDEIMPATDGDETHDEHIDDSAVTNDSDVPAESTASRPTDVPIEPGESDTHQLPEDRIDHPFLETDRSSHSTDAETMQARTALNRAIVRLAGRAADADDPKTARAYLEAAREATAALSDLPDR